MNADVNKAELSGIAATMAGADGVTVVQEGADYQVAFVFSNTMVAKMKTVPDAKFNKEQGLWNVPAASANELIAAVDDMRDFVRCNGVQVKDVEGGGKQVLFDYNKDLAKIIGGVAGAEFDKQTYVWNVPATVMKGDKENRTAVPNPALATVEGKETSYLDMAINTMRGMAIEELRDRGNIIDLAAASPQLQGLKIAPVYPKPGQSSTGPIVSVNGHFAAQKSGDKDGAGFVTIHDLTVIGDVFKGDELRIDYDEKMHPDVRTAALFKQQQADREMLTSKAGGLVDGAEVKNSSMKDGKYSGVVKGVTDSMVLLSGGRNTFTLHRRDQLAGVKIVDGQKLDVVVKDGKATAVDPDLVRDTQGQGR